MTVMTHIVALEAGQSSHGTFESMTPVHKLISMLIFVRIYLFSPGRGRES